MMKNISLGLAFLCAMWLGGVINAFIFSPNVGIVILSNRSSQVISSAQVSICGQDLIFSDIPIGDYAVARYDVITDSHYDVRVSLKSGHTMDIEAGYVTNNADFFDVFEVTEDDVIHTKSVLLGCNWPFDAKSR